MAITPTTPANGFAPTPAVAAAAAVLEVTPIELLDTVPVSLVTSAVVVGLLLPLLPPPLVILAALLPPAPPISRTIVNALLPKLVAQHPR